MLQVVYYKNDTPIGVAWRRLIGGSYLVGKLDKESGEFTGKDVLYLYPDLISGIQGQFEDSKLIAGYNCTVEYVELDKESGVLIPKVTKLQCDTMNNFTVKRDVSTSKRISKTPLIRDEWEKQKVEVRGSEVKTEDGLDAGEGLFAKAKIENGQVVALFNGVRQQSEKNSTSDYRIRLNGDTDIDILDEFKDTKNYCATLGHKTNHSFTPNCR